MKHTTYSTYEHYISLNEYFRTPEDRRRKANEGVAESLMLFYRMANGESIYRRLAKRREAVFPAEWIERYAVLLSNNESFSPMIHQLLELVDTDVTQKCFWEVNCADWKTLAEARSNGYFNGCFAEKRETTEATMHAVKSVLAYLHRSFGLPASRRIYLDDETHSATSTREYPGWLLRFASHVCDADVLQREASRAEV